MSIKDRGNIFKEVWRLSSQAPIGTNESCWLNPPHAGFDTELFCIDYLLATGFIPNIAQALDGLRCVVCWGLSEILVLFQSVARCAALWRLKEKGKSSVCTDVKLLWGGVMGKKKGHLFFPPHTCPKSEEGSVTACNATRSVGLQYAGPCVNIFFLRSRKIHVLLKFTRPHTQGKAQAILEKKPFLVLLSVG